MLSRLKGMHDFIDFSAFQHVVSQIRTHLQQHGYAEIATPLVEDAQLFIRSLGTHTDVVSKEMFMLQAFHDEQQLCLRPEGTASIMRAFLEHAPQALPWKVFLCGPMFRYERPQKGRYRQFHQVSVELIGSDAVAQDAAFIKLFERLFQEVFGLDQYALDINFLGCRADRAVYRQQLLVFLHEHALEVCSTCKQRTQHNPLRIFDCKSQECAVVYQNAPRMIDALCVPCAQEWDWLQNALQLLNVSYNVRSSLVRGLDYYDKTVFEFSSTLLGAQSAFCGGGRYNSLAQEIGSTVSAPSIGAAIGLERLLMLLEAAQKPVKTKQLPLFCVIPFDAQQHIPALLLADAAVDHSYAIEVLTEPVQVGQRIKRAVARGAKAVVILGSDEVAAHTATVKNLSTGEQHLVKQVELRSALSALACFARD